MVHQTPLENSSWSGPEGNGHRQSAAAGVREGVGDLLHDIVALSELQAQLLAVDARDSAQKAQMPLALFGAGIAFGLGAVPVLLLGLAEALVLLLDWERAVAYPLSGLLGAA